MCAPGSLCIGISANNRSICVCSIDKWSSQCLLSNEICQSNKKTTLYHNGGYFGDTCEMVNNKIILSFEKDVILSQLILVHFIEVINNATHEIGATFKTIPFYRNSIIFNWSRSFYIALFEFF
ncbi:unnamed protein product [Rotaria sp. Silwood2]|nr:unnamed protein product [Rotaria sp. Silwood2]CAF3301906.1 unnamed protein product [Rotaria sp. Silwood2]CAF4060056.1 unnamed protein product [Rotaria sp. Silwood2]CAF4451874.1 unnamed protein product [Rotaria sp. Silwood2]